MAAREHELGELAGVVAELLDGDAQGVVTAQTDDVVAGDPAAVEISDGLSSRRARSTNDVE